MGDSHLVADDAVKRLHLCRFTSFLVLLVGRPADMLAPCPARQRRYTSRSLLIESVRNLYGVSSKACDQAAVLHTSAQRTTSSST